MEDSKQDFGVWMILVERFWYCMEDSMFGNSLCGELHFFLKRHMFCFGFYTARQAGLFNRSMKSVVEVNAQSVHYRKIIK